MITNGYRINSKCVTTHTHARTQKLLLLSSLYHNLPLSLIVISSAACFDNLNLFTDCTLRSLSLMVLFFQLTIYLSWYDNTFNFNNAAKAHQHNQTEEDARMLKPFPSFSMKLLKIGLFISFYLFLIFVSSSSVTTFSYHLFRINLLICTRKLLIDSHQSIG